MRIIFTLLLFLGNILSIQAQNEGESITKVFYRSLKFDSIQSGHLKAMTFERFQQHIRTSEVCLLSLPQDEYILKLNDHFVITAQFIYNEPYRRKLSSFAIENCELKLIASSIFPFESEFYVSQKGEVIRSDFYKGYGKKLQLLDQSLEVKMVFEPFEEGFKELSVLDKGEFWLLDMSPNKTKAGNKLFRINKTSHSISKL